MAELVGLNTQVPDILPKLAELLQVQRARTQLAGEQQTQRQRQALAKFDYNQLLGEDGTFDLDKIPLVQEAAGDLYPEIARHLIDAKSAQLDAKSKLLNLDTDTLNTYRSLVGGLLQDPEVAFDTDAGRQKVNDAYMQFGETYGAKTLPILESYAKRLQNVPKGKLRDALVTYQMQAEHAGSQLEKQRPNYLNTGAEARDVNPYSPGAAPTSPTVPMSISPGFSQFTDPRTGNTYLVNAQTGETRDIGSGYPGQAPKASRGVSPTASPTAAPTAPASMPKPFYPGQTRDITTQQDEVTNTRNAADQVPAARGINQEILRLSKDTMTGPGTAAWRDTRFGGMFGDNYQELGKYLEKNAIANMQAMGGPPSDARLSAASAANGSTKFNAGALQAVTKFNDASTSGLELYRRGMDKAVGTRNADYAALPDFKAAWARNFDIDVFRIENAERDGDKEELARLRKEILAKPGRARELAQKRRNLEALTTTGRLP